MTKLRFFHLIWKKKKCIFNGDLSTVMTSRLPLSLAFSLSLSLLPLSTRVHVHSLGPITASRPALAEPPAR